MRAHNGQDRYSGRIVRFADGDTVIVIIELGWGAWREFYVRLVNLDSWELDDDGRDSAIAARDLLDKEFSWKLCVLVPHTKGFDRYGRIRGTVLIPTGDLAKWIVDHQLGWWHGEESLPARSNGQ